MSESLYIDVAVALPLDNTFTYRLPEDMLDAAGPGSRVLVPFGARSVTGYVLGPARDADKEVEIKDVIDVLDERPAFPESLLADLRWMADYYIYPIGETLKGALPAGINIESSAALTITPEGEKALADLRTSEADRGILAAIAAEPGIKQKRLIASSQQKKGDRPYAPARSILNRMVKSGWILREERIMGARVAERSQLMARISPSVRLRVGEIIVETARRAPARAKLLAYIDSAGEAPLPELSKRFPNAGAQVKALEKEGVIVTRRARVWRDPALGDVPEYEEKPPVLTKDQSAAFKEIASALERRVYEPFLLHGVTGSGKTEVYLRAIAETLGAGRQALALVPEIALTPQLLGRFRARFGAEVAVMHSGMGGGERLDEWSKVRDGKARVAIGARSAIFAPFHDLGLIVVDEEHDGGYKQDEKISYNARDFALVRGRSMNAAVVLGSATPSLESWHNAEAGRYRLLSLPHRVEARPLPEVELVDLRSAKKGRSEFISQRLEEEIIANFERRKQTILFLNRRGFAPFMLCVKCGHTFRCPSCSVSLTFHQKQRRLICHFCDYKATPPNICPECRGAHIKMVGMGTERIEEEIRRIIPAARVGRLDRDAVSRRGELSRILGALKDGSLDILVGTQMVAKGHDYPGVTLVGVLMAETSLNLPDFRAAETTFALLTQVAGRAGRGRDAGRVIVQTYNPAHYAIRRALEHDYEGFAREEMGYRRELDYPPYNRLVALRISGPNPVGTRKAALAAGDAARRCKGVRAAGPAPAPWAKIKNMHRWQLLIKSASSKAARDAAKFVVENVAEKIKSEKAKIAVDIDPLRLL